MLFKVLIDKDHDIPCANILVVSHFYLVGDKILDRLPAQINTESQTQSKSNFEEHTLNTRHNQELNSAEHIRTREHTEKVQTLIFNGQLNFEN